jgi:hypothetical protein
VRENLELGLGSTIEVFQFGAHKNMVNTSSIRPDEHNSVVDLTYSPQIHSAKISSKINIQSLNIYLNLKSLRSIHNSPVENLLARLWAFDFGKTPM